MEEEIVAAITKAESRKRLWHFTRASNLPAIAHFDALWPSVKINPTLAAGRRRPGAAQSKHDGYTMTVNAHLRIADGMFDASVKQEQFRAFLDRHVFLWPTLRDCRQMIDSYARREPGERFAVLAFDAPSLLLEHYSAVKLSKYDSGSSPRYPSRCSYRKSLAMFLPLSRFKLDAHNPVPTKASEIKEILVEHKVRGVFGHLLAVYVDRSDELPVRWRRLVRPLADLQKNGGG
ncbi:DUF7002 family protein [Paenibacillus arenilitoris]|uniref:Uncharacterized protein n=1 Tax=Paenibacillus arenilitoris TaxID=2772299 RepID=A0A927H4N8_9BACL|nr:hypothetical protein [Paenibacillus arenilitoris]MBD2868085.1 hypothetical protein [Paenibacillus arenilitoris]